MALEDAKSQVDTAITRKGRRGMAYENAFGGVTSFMRRSLSKDLLGVDLAVTGIPFDQAVTNRPGARLGPRAIREASSLQAFDAPYGWDYNPFEVFDIVDYGDLAFDYAAVADFPATLQAHIAGILSTGAGCIALGGDHSISLPILRAHAARHGPLALVQFDAHTDTWADDDPARIDHGTMFGKAVREGLIDPARSVQVGIRTDNPDPMGIAILDAPFVHENGPAACAARIKTIIGDAPVYLSFDIDALDPAFAPGTGTPVWGGLASWQVAAILRALAGLDIVGGDIVEVSPPYDTSAITAIAGAHVAVELICLWGWTRRPVNGEKQ
ncbi:agmatinase [Rhodovulum bhavnagarense]|uniref:Agmatinase n=1 Tax=Rhodovulum bhavnagarense TaxID=992286 RepID=A0A4R2RVT6_9RHOB|nr:agmatinase [Rhodovulum bhavnagarense]TCP63245.1 agmatinase [Rhodovulum bhavnagarense]